MSTVHFVGWLYERIKMEVMRGLRVAQMRDTYLRCRICGRWFKAAHWQ